MPDDGLFVRVDNQEGGVVVTVRGELDLLAAPNLERALSALDSATAILVDCSGVEFMDSTALRVLLSHSMRVTADGGTLHVRNPSKQALHVLQISGLDHLIDR